VNRRPHPSHDDRGAALIIAIGFMVLVGFIVGGLAALISSGVGDSVILTNIRDRQYAADAAVQQGIVQVRAALAANTNANWCTDPAAHTYNDVNGTNIRLGCTQTVKLTFSNGTLYTQRNVIFEACTDTATVCNDASKTLVLRAEVNFSTVSGATSTFIQSWSVIT
jgi:Tfp pilus assembly protein PilX